MKPLLFLSFALIFSGIVGSINLASYGSQENRPEALPFSKLTLEIQSPKEEFLPLEPIPINLKLENHTTKPALGHTALKFSQNYVELFAIGPNGFAKKIDIAKPVTKLVDVAPKIFEPGESHVSTDLLAVGTSDFLFSPGEYRIQAVIH